MGVFMVERHFPERLHLWLTAARQRRDEIVARSAARIERTEFVIQRSSQVIAKARRGIGSPIK